MLRFLNAHSGAKDYHLIEEELLKKINTLKAIIEKTWIKYEDNIKYIKVFYEENVELILTRFSKYKLSEALEADFTELLNAWEKKAYPINSLLQETYHLFLFIISLLVYEAFLRKNSLVKNILIENELENEIDIEKIKQEIIDNYQNECLIKLFKHHEIRLQDILHSEIKKLNYKINKFNIHLSPEYSLKDKIQFLFSQELRLKRSKKSDMKEIDDLTLKRKNFIQKNTQFIEEYYGHLKSQLNALPEPNPHHSEIFKSHCKKIVALNAYIENLSRKLFLEANQINLKHNLQAQLLLFKKLLNKYTKNMSYSSWFLGYDLTQTFKEYITLLEDSVVFKTVNKSLMDTLDHLNTECKQYEKKNLDLENTLKEFCSKKENIVNKEFFEKYLDNKKIYFLKLLDTVKNINEDYTKTHFIKNKLDAEWKRLFTEKGARNLIAQYIQNVRTRINDNRFKIEEELALDVIQDIEKKIIDFTDSPKNHANSLSITPKKNRAQVSLSDKKSKYLPFKEALIFSLSVALLLGMISFGWWLILPLSFITFASSVCGALLISGSIGLSGAIGYSRGLLILSKNKVSLENATSPFTPNKIVLKSPNEASMSPDKIKTNCDLHFFPKNQVSLEKPAESPLSSLKI